MNSPARILFNYAIKRKSVYRVGNPLGVGTHLFFFFPARVLRAPDEPRECDYGRIINFVLSTSAMLHYPIKNKSSNRAERKGGEKGRIEKMKAVYFIARNTRHNVLIYILAFFVGSTSL